MVRKGYWTCPGDPFTLYSVVGRLFPETNIVLYLNYISIFKKKIIRGHPRDHPSTLGFACYTDFVKRVTRSQSCKDMGKQLGMASAKAPR